MDGTSAIVGSNTGSRAIAEPLPGVIRWGNLPVPFVAAWSSETAIRIARDPLYNNQPAIYRDGGRGLGTPLFGKMAEDRTRFVLARRVCQVCAEPLRGPGYVIDTIVGASGQKPIYTEPLSCLRCFRVAVALCPGIQRTKQRPRGHLIECSAYEVIASYVGKAEGPRADPDLNAALDRWKGDAPIGSARYSPTSWDVLPFSWFERGHA